MKLSIISSALLLALSASSYAANNCGSSSMYERGTNNGWGNYPNVSSPMTCDYTGNWSLSTNVAAAGSFKFDQYNNWTPGAEWGDNNGDKIADAGGANIPLPAGLVGISFNYANKKYQVNSCKGGTLSVNQTSGYNPPRLSMLCGSAGLYRWDALLAATNQANPDSSSPWPWGTPSFEVRNLPAGNLVKTISAPVEGMYRYEINGETKADSLTPLDCGGYGLSAVSSSSLGGYSTYPMTCDKTSMTYKLDFVPQWWQGNIGFVDGLGRYYRDADKNLVLERQSTVYVDIPVTTNKPVSIQVNLRNKQYSLKPTCGTTSLKASYASGTGKEQSYEMTCNTTDKKWHLALDGAYHAIRFQDANNVYYGDNNGDKILDISGTLIGSNAATEVIVDYATKVYSFK